MGFCRPQLAEALLWQTTGALQLISAIMIFRMVEWMGGEADGWIHSFIYSFNRYQISIILPGTVPSTVRKWHLRPEIWNLDWHLESKGYSQSYLCSGSRRIVEAVAKKGEVTWDDGGRTSQICLFPWGKNIFLANHSLLIQIHGVRRRKNTQQANVSFRFTLEGI